MVHWFVKSMAAIVLVVAALGIPSVYVHEYTHYIQAGCHIENDGVGFFERMSWGSGPEYMEKEPLAYIDVGGCKRPRKVNEWGALVVHFLFMLVTTLSVSAWVSVKMWDM